MTNYGELVRLLVSEGVEFMLVGGVAGMAHGAARTTYDLDVLYRTAAENIQRLVRCLGPLSPYLRGAPPGLPFKFDAETVKRGLNFTLATTLGDLDLLGEILGGGRYEDLSARAIETRLFKTQCKCIDLASLIKTKRAAGRPKDLEANAELEVLLEKQQKQ
jgi:hypothetical protein